MSSLAIITARGGSKRIPRKNLRPFLGKPILSYSIDAAIKSDAFDVVMVSTDDPEIKSVAVSLGASVPFFRSPKNSDDRSSTVDVLGEVLEQYEKSGQRYDRACCLYPTAPFVTPQQLREAMSLLSPGKVETVIPVVKYGHPIQRALEIKEGRLKMIHPEYALTHSQLLEPAYHDPGQFYCFIVRSFLATKRLFGEKVHPMVLSELEAQDIDNEVDWKLAELKFQLRLDEKAQ